MSIVPGPAAAGADEPLAPEQATRLAVAAAVHAGTTSAL